MCLTALLPTSLHNDLPKTNRIIVLKMKMVLTCRVRRSFWDEWRVCIQEQSLINLIWINKWAMLKPMLSFFEGAGLGPTSMVYGHGKTGKMRDAIWIWHNFSADEDSKGGTASCPQWFAIQQIVIYRYLYLIALLLPICLWPKVCLICLLQIKKPRLVARIIHGCFETYPYQKAWVHSEVHTILRSTNYSP